VTLTIDRRTQLLGACPLFGGVSPDDLVAIGDRAIEVDFPAEHVIARQGEIGTGFFVVIEGHVRVVRDGEELARLGAGDFFGEMSVIDGKPRSAAVRAETDMVLMMLGRRQFMQVVNEQPTVAIAIMEELAARVRRLEGSA
jgi:CRP/FNR family transcriptional regulator, cyclic AMP receptor protein